MFRVLLTICTTIVLFTCSNEAFSRAPTEGEISQLFALKKEILNELDLAVKSDIGSQPILKIDIERPKPDLLTENRFKYYFTTVRLKLELQLSCESYIYASFGRSIGKNPC
jgi:hypothetical protein